MHIDNSILWMYVLPMLLCWAVAYCISKKDKSTAEGLCMLGLVPFVNLAIIWYLTCSKISHTIRLFRKKKD
jgi:hypothetical protein